MDEASQQLLHEHRHCEAKLEYDGMKTESSIPSSPSSGGSDAPSTPTMAPAGFDSPHSQRSEGGQISALQASLLSGKFSDLTVIHGEKKWKAHKVVVCAQSNVLESMIKNEGSTSTIDLKDYPAAAVARLMDYLYTNTYTTRNIAPDFALHSHVRVFCLATTLAIPALQSLAEERFRYALNNHVTDLTVYLSSIRLIYAATPPEHPGLRNAVTEAAACEMRTLLGADHTKKTFFEFLVELPDFHTDILRFFAENPNRPVLLVVQPLCEACGPMDAEDNYKLETECKGCGKMKSYEFN